MTLPRWDDDMKFELLRLKSELRPENFRVLHTPIGLGRATKIALATEARESAKAFSTPELVTQRRPEGNAVAGKSRRDVPGLPQMETTNDGPQPRSWSKLAIIHALDVGFVVMTLGLGLLLASWLIDPGHVSDDPERLKQAAPLRFILETHLVSLVFGLYGFFSLYWLFFKLVTGSTLGESFLDNFWSLQNPRGPARVKDSGDS